MKIYYTKIEQLPEMEWILKMLPQERAERIRRMKAEKSRKQSMAAGLLLEYAFREMGFSGKELTFLKNADGKPYIKERPELYYNLSHSGVYVALVLDNCPVGIDIEETRERSKKLAERFFSEAEKECLLNQWSDEAFTRVWTRKESFLKATGFGMRMPLDAFSTVKERVEINEKMPTDMVNPKEDYYIKSLALADGLWLSACRKDVLLMNAECCCSKKSMNEIIGVLGEYKRCMMN